MLLFCCPADRCCGQRRIASSSAACAMILVVSVFRWAPFASLVTKSLFSHTENIPMCRAIPIESHPAKTSKKKNHPREEERLSALGNKEY